MTMIIKKFIDDTSGAVTVDWTVLAAAIVGLGISSVAAVRAGVVSMGDDVSLSLSGATVASLGELGSAVTGFVPLFYTQPELDQHIDFFTNNAATSDADLVSLLRRFATNARSAIDAGYGVPVRIETAYIYEQALINRGVPIPADIPNVAQLYTDYRAANP